MKTSGVTALALAAAACATVGEPPPGPPAFEEVRTVALVRWRDDPGVARAKDPLDALEESLAARDVATRAVEIGPRTEDASRALERLHSRLATRIVQGPPRGRYGRGAEPLGAEAADAVAALGVDAVALHHRADAFGLGALPRARAPVLGDPFPPSASPPSATLSLRRPLGALSLVDRRGNAIWFEWGAPESELDPSAPVNAAEAVDALLRVLAGEGEGEER
jgi:hypothetical protein